MDRAAQDHDTSWVRTDKKYDSPGDSCYAGDVCDGAATWLPPGSSLKVLGVIVGYAVYVRAPSSWPPWENIAASMLT